MQDLSDLTSFLDKFGSWTLEMTSIGPEGVPKRTKKEVTNKVQLAIGPCLLVTLPPQDQFPAVDLRDRTPSERRSIWRAKMEEYRRQMRDKKKRGKDTTEVEAKIQAMRRRIEDEKED